MDLQWEKIVSIMFIVLAILILVILEIQTFLQNRKQIKDIQANIEKIREKNRMNELELFLLETLEEKNQPITLSLILLIMMRKDKDFACDETKSMLEKMIDGGSVKKEEAGEKTLYGITDFGLTLLKVLQKADEREKNCSLKSA